MIAMHPLHLGQTSDAVGDLQRRLLSLDLQIDPRELGGTFGRSTERVVREFQQRRGLIVDGAVGPQTWREVVEAGWRLGQRPLYLRRPPLRGDDVRTLQGLLASLGFAAGKQDGIFGPSTAAALREFQRNLALDDDGLCGPGTLKAFGRLGPAVRTSGLSTAIHEREHRVRMPRGVRDKRVAIDAGASLEIPAGRDLAPEADLSFSIAARLGIVLEEKRATPLLARGPKSSPTASQRARVINNAGADVAISIRPNAHTSPVAEGACTYYYGNEVFHSESGAALAASIQAALVNTGRVNCRYHPKTYPILRETRMPAVVVEPGFITNPREAAQLADPSFQQHIAEALLEGLRSFFEAGSGAVSGQEYRTEDS